MILHESNLAEHLFSSPGMGRVRAVVVNGSILYQNGEFAHVDEARLRARAREISKELNDPRQSRGLIFVSPSKGQVHEPPEGG